MKYLFAVCCFLFICACEGDLSDETAEIGDISADISIAVYGQTVYGKSKYGERK